MHGYLDNTGSFDLMGPALAKASAGMAKRVGECLAAAHRLGRSFPVLVRRASSPGVCTDSRIAGSRPLVPGEIPAVMPAAMAPRRGDGE